ncbi:hypothetical protein ACIBF5_11850 [Micromonospora sp. NPDC050417]|uniref:hypothetical protein n=1 Tax=Micromonospora sp. NPDC050417 TaxID=3364280 RepID=UPI00378778DD
METRGRPAAPGWVTVVVRYAVAVFVYGTVVHLFQLATGGTHPYPDAPTWLAVYFVSLTLLDPLAAGLLAARRAEGLFLGCAVLLTDAIAAPTRPGSSK